MKNVVILGFGVVGSGVAEVIAMNSDKIEKHVGDKVQIKYILDLRDFPGNPFEHLVTHDSEVVFNDPEVNVFVETIGGCGVAYAFTKRALSSGKSVVTSNKELVATHGPELMEIAKQNGCIYLYEAAVGGGIPIIRPLHRCLAANKVVRIAGIVNGTTNYILTNMRDAGVSYDEALKQAQANGYAEQNPTADVEGIDAQRKLSILSSIAMDGAYVSPDEIKAVGISKVTLDDILFAQKVGCKVKLLAVFNNSADNKPVSYVAPHFVKASSMLNPVEDVFNAVLVEGNALGESMFYGRGAGKLPTASAVVGDILEAVMPVDAIAYSHNWVVPAEGERVTLPYEEASSNIVVWGKFAVDTLKAAFSGFDVEVALDGEESAIFVKNIANKDIENKVSAVAGAKWMHLYE